MNDREMNEMLASWVQGFLSGMNTHRRMATKQEFVPIPDPPTILAYVDKYCREQPLKMPLQASIQLFQDIQDSAPRSNTSLERTRER
jgi:hypothetical protein